MMEDKSCCHLNQSDIQKQLAIRKCVKHKTCGACWAILRIREIGTEKLALLFAPLIDINDDIKATQMNHSYKMKYAS